MANNSRFSHPFTYSQPALTSKASTTNYSNPAISNNLTPNAGAWNASGTSTSVTGSQGTASNIPKRIRSTSPEPSREGSDESKRRQAKLNSNDADRDDSSDDEPKAYVNPHQNVLDLPHAFYVDQAIMSEEDRLVVIRFGDHRDPDCQRQDEVLEKCAKITRQWCVFYKCDNRRGKVPDFNQMYELYDKTTIMFFFRNKHMMCDFGTGNNNKINWVLDNKDEMVDILEVIYKGARKGRGLVNSPKDYSTRHAY
ncbi:MAG: hypothetical protein LQ340_005304 [Diploschistes diacapsis]|nr:MAG: hypothetical protein LQ340_005304 [Diploschistes diacapsis]